MNEGHRAWPVYLPALVLISAVALGYVAASGWQYDDQPWTIYLTLPAVFLMVLAFFLLLFDNALAVLSLLAAVLLALPYYVGIYVRVLVNIISGKEGYVFTAVVLSLIAVLVSFTVFKALNGKDVA